MPFPFFWKSFSLTNAVRHCSASTQKIRVGIEADVSENGLPLEGYLKITLVELTYPKAWTRSLPLCSLIFSWCHRSHRFQPQLTRIIVCIYSSSYFLGPLLEVTGSNKILKTLICVLQWHLLAVSHLLTNANLGSF